mgnify:CR=1 FL=1
MACYVAVGSRSSGSSGEAKRRRQLHGLAAGLVASPGERRRKRWGIGAQEVEAGPRGGFNARLPSTL